jgi:hypothetical protein
MTKHPTQYPDISGIIDRKRKGRREIARLSFGEKIAMMEALRERIAPLKRAREQRRETLKAHAPSLTSSGSNT